MTVNGITTEETPEQELEHLVAELLDAQDEERRRIASELHDTTAQHLAAVLMGIDHLLATRHDGVPPLMRQTRLLVDQSLREIRALCYRLHPPMLEELGLASALNWLVRGVEQGTGLAISLELAPDLGRLPPEIETGTFRLVQAELANLVEHAGVAKIGLTLRRSANSVALDIKAEGGAAFDVFNVCGSGRTEAEIGGMRTRMHRMGGSLWIVGSPAVARMLVRLPVPCEMC